MNLDYSVEIHKLQFNTPAKTSRNVFKEKLHWIIKIWNANNPKVIGLGEAAPIELLSPDYSEDLEITIKERLELLKEGLKFEDLDMDKYPSIKFAIECALLDLNNGGKQHYFNSNYLTGQPIPINGLVWMNELDEMLIEAFSKVKLGFKCIKFKIGSHDFDSECRLLEQFRKSELGKNIIVRLDANGAFKPDEAIEKLKELQRFHIHSIEQPIKAGQFEFMAKICKDSKIAIALDEELIGIKTTEYRNVLNTIKPHYIIIKPTLLGGFLESDQWILLANKLNIGWWATSALESNIGLNAIAQWIGKYNTNLPQGLGTGLLYKNNFKPKSEIIEGNLFYKI